MLDWDPVLPFAPRASEPVASRFPCSPAPVDVPSPAVGVASSPLPADSAFIADALADNTMDLWHHRLGHSSERVIRKMAKSGCIPAHSINLRDRLSFCESCAATGMEAVGPVPTAARQPDSPSLPTRMLEELSIDVAGPYPKDKKGNRYFVLLVDRFTRFKYVGLMKKKSDTFDHFMSFCSSASRQNPDVSVDDVVSVRMDGGASGGEFSGIRDFSAAHGIKVLPTGRGNPNGNALAEVSIGKICFKMRATLHASSLPHSYWSEALLHAIESTNRVPTRALEGSVSPYEKGMVTLPLFVISVLLALLAMCINPVSFGLANCH